MRTDVEERVCFEKRVRFYISVVLLILLFLVPLLFTIRVGSGTVNLAVASFQMLFSLLFITAIKTEALYLLKYGWASKILLVSMCLCFLGWLFYFIPVFGLFRTWFYLAQPLFFLAFVGWFRAYGDTGFSWVFLAKLISTLFALIVISIYLSDTPDTLKFDVRPNPPIYSHIRHLNYDLAFVASLSFYYYRISGRVIGSLFLLLLAVVGYFTVWSFARGELLSLAIFLGILFLNKYRLTKMLDKATLLPLAFFVIGAVFVFLLGETYLVQQNYIAAESMDQYSSGRISTWQQAFMRLNEYHAWLFGMGPDASLRLGIQRGGTVQPHNFLVQWLLEFGIVGTFGLCAAFGSVATMAFKLLRNNASFRLPQAVAALFLSTLCYALVDGQFYHGLALSMILIMCAYLVVLDSAVDRR